MPCWITAEGQYCPGRAQKVRICKIPDLAAATSSMSCCCACSAQRTLSSKACVRASTFIPLCCSRSLACMTYPGHVLGVKVGRDCKVLRDEGANRCISAHVTMLLANYPSVTSIAIYNPDSDRHSWARFSQLSTPPQWSAADRTPAEVPAADLGRHRALLRPAPLQPCAYGP